MTYYTSLRGIKLKIEKSEKKEKKLKATFINPETQQENTLHFGDVNYSHYKDKSGLLNKDLNHLDKKRRIRYRIRHLKDLKNKGITRGLLSYYILW